MIIVPGLPDEPSPADMATAKLVATAVLAFDDLLRTIDNSQVRAEAPILLVQFLSANIAQSAIAAGLGEDDIRNLCHTLLDSARRGWSSGIEASMHLLSNARRCE